MRPPFLHRLSRVVAAFALPVVLAPALLRAAEDAKPERVPLWAEGAPGANGQEPKDQPWLDLYRPEKEKQNGCAVVICPGGGYGMLAADHEGIQPAKFFNEFGVTAYVLHYRLPANGYRHPVPLQDAQRALRLARSRAEQDGVDPARVGIMGFSAGGHLASTAGTHYDAGNPQAADPVDRLGCRPDFLVLCYGVLSFDPAITHGGSVKNLLGDKHNDPELLKLLSNEEQVNAQTPPTFLFSTGDDAAVPVENSLRFYAALRKHRVPAELHVYQSGPHGVGLAPGDPVLGTWPDRLRAWMRVSGLLAAQKPKTVEVKGRVKVNGKPVSWGSITFTPENESLAAVALRANGGNFRGNVPEGASFVSFNFSAKDAPDTASAAKAGSVSVSSLDGGEPLKVSLAAGEPVSLDYDIRWPR